LIQKTDKWKYVNLNPMAPTIRGLINVHKEGAAIRPIINWKNAPAYKLAKMLAKKLHTHPPSLRIQYGKHSPTDERLEGHPIRQEHEIRIPRSN
jgi:hypothetical protein